MKPSQTKPRQPWPRRLALFAVAVALAAAWGSVVQTQFNLNALTALGVAVAPALRLQTTLQDLRGFGPAYAGIVLVAWLPAFAAAAWLARRQPAWRLTWFGLAAGVGLVVAIRSIDAVAPMPVLIDATRGTAGLLAMTLGSVLAGMAFGHWTRPAGALSRPGMTSV
jgi:hypothetical protein